MTKGGLIEVVAEGTPHISKKDTEIVVNTIFESMARALQEGERIFALVVLQEVADVEAEPHVVEVTNL